METIEAKKVANRLIKKEIFKVRGVGSEEGEMWGNYLEKFNG